MATDGLPPWDMDPDTAFARMQAVVERESVSPGQLELRNGAHGRGLFATRDIPAGTAVLDGPAFTFMSDNEALNSYALALVAHGAHAVLGDDVFALQRHVLAMGSPAEMGVLEAWNTPQATAIGTALLINRFGTVCRSAAGDGKKRVACTSMARGKAAGGMHGDFLALGASMINHACPSGPGAETPSPNTAIFNMGKAGKPAEHCAVVATTHDVPAGAELSIHYGDCASMPDSFGFVCGCGKTAGDVPPWSASLQAAIVQQCQARGYTNEPYLVDASLLMYHPGNRAFHVVRNWAAFMPGAPPLTMEPTGVLRSLARLREPEDAKLIADVRTALHKGLAMHHPWVADLTPQETAAVDRWLLNAARVACNVLPTYLYMCVPPGDKPKSGLAKAVMAAVTSWGGVVTAPIAQDPARQGAEDVPLEPWQETFMASVNM